MNRDAPNEPNPAAPAAPAALGYHWPAEWEPHRSTWLSWPHNRETWPGRFERIPPVFEKLVRTLAEVETVNILAGGDVVMADAEKRIGHVENVVLWDIPTNDCWTRDHGPTFLSHEHGGPPALIDWQYNAWGGKYPPFDLDNAAPQKIATLTGHRRFNVELVLEGGAIEGNGQGTVLVNDNCIINANRNPAVAREQVERILQDHVSAKKVLCITGGDLAGDDTDGHIDQLARFVDRTTVVAAWCDDESDPNFASLANVHRQLEGLTTALGEPLTIVRLPIPRPLFHDNHRLPASYCNYYVANDVLILPQFGDPADRAAVATLGDCFPGREIIGIDTIDLVWGLGAFHCVTQQEPA